MNSNLQRDCVYFIIAIIFAKWRDSGKWLLKSDRQNLYKEKWQQLYGKPFMQNLRRKASVFGEQCSIEPQRGNSFNHLFCSLGLASWNKLCQLQMGFLCASFLP